MTILCGDISDIILKKNNSYKAVLPQKKLNGFVL